MKYNVLGCRKRDRSTAPWISFGRILLRIKLDKTENDWRGVYISRTLSSATVTYSACEAIEFHEITRNHAYYAVEGHSRSPILVPIESPYVTSYW